MGSSSSTWNPPSQGVSLLPQGKALTPVDDYQALGLPSPNQMEALKAFCHDMSGTPFLPPSLVANKSPEQRAGILLAVILTGKEMGLLPMFCLRAFWLSPDGRLGMYADAMSAVMRSHGVGFKWIDNSNTGVKVEATRGTETYTAEFTWNDALQAGLASKNTWKAYPKAMCRARCISEIFRALCSDLGGTQMYSQEELIDMEPEVGPSGETRYVQADKAAEADPALSITLKAEPVEESTSRPAEAAPAPAPEPPPPPAPPKVKSEADLAKEAYKTVLAEIRELVPGLKKNHPTEWLAGWFGDAEADKRTPQACAAAISTLCEVLKSYPKAKEQLLADALELGVKMRLAERQNAEAAAEDIPNEAAEPPADDSDPIPGVPDSAIATEFGWDAQTCSIASTIIRNRAKVNGDDKAIVNALLGFGFKGMDSLDATAMLTMYAYDTDAFLLRRKGEAKKITPSKLLLLVEDVLKKKMTEFPPGSPEPIAAMNQVMSNL